MVVDKDDFLALVELFLEIAILALLEGRKLSIDAPREVQGEQILRHLRILEKDLEDGS